MRHRPAIDRPPESRAFVDQALDQLRRSRWTPGAWAAFLRRCGARSAEQARLHPRAALEVTALHLALLPLGCSLLRPAASWAMAITHVGLLGPGERSIGPATALTLLRANLPPGRWSPVVAIATDVADGFLARRTTSTAFGAYADGLADVAFWTGQVWAREPSRALRVAATAAWLLPLSVTGAAYFASGRTIDYPRPFLVRRMMAGLQCLLAARALGGRLEE
jgi:phosphatidylglycerophosphate synthase